jgi:DNA invertase Pin-like site-specific DNA recombinase
MSTTRGTPAAIYLRISDDREGEGLGVARQEKDCRALVERNRWDLVEVFTDNDRSAFERGKRPQWQRLVQAVEADEVAVLVAWASDRLTRHPRELEDLVDLLDEHKVRVVTVTSGEYDLTTPEGRAYARIVGAIARQESERKSVRAKRKAEELASAGKVGGGGHRPFGYESDRITIRKDEGALIREAVASVNDGARIRSIIWDWSQRDIRTSTGKPWVAGTLKRTLMSPRIAGLREHQGEVVGEAEWDGVVDRSEWEQCRARLIANGNGNRRRSRKYLLTGGLAVCGRCEEPLVARPTGDGSPAYVCPSPRSGPNYHGCGKLKIRAEGFEEHVAEQVLDAIDSPAFAEVLAAEAASMSGVDAAGVVAEIEGLEASLEQLARDHYADRLIGRAEYLAARKAVEAKLEATRASLTPKRIGKLPPAGEALRSWWESAPIDERQEVIRLIVEAVVVNPAVRGRNFFDSVRVGIRWA